MTTGLSALVFILLSCFLQSKELTAYQSHQEKKGTLTVPASLRDCLIRLGKCVHIIFDICLIAYEVSV